MTYYSVNRACGVLLLDFLENMGTYWLQWLVVFQFVHWQHRECNFVYSRHDSVNHTMVLITYTYMYKL